MPTSRARSSGTGSALVPEQDGLPATGVGLRLATRSGLLLSIALRRPGRSASLMLRFIPMTVPRAGGMVRPRVLHGTRASSSYPSAVGASGNLDRGREVAGHELSLARRVDGGDPTAVAVLHDADHHVEVLTRTSGSLGVEGARVRAELERDAVAVPEAARARCPDGRDLRVGDGRVDEERILVPEQPEGARQAVSDPTRLVDDRGHGVTGHGPPVVELPVDDRRHRAQPTRKVVSGGDVCDGEPQAIATIGSARCRRLGRKRQARSATATAQPIRRA